MHVALGLAVSAVCCWIALRQVDLGDVADTLGEADYPWLVPALAALMVANWMRAERWRAIFPPEERPGLSPAFWSLQIGLFFNTVLPARAGEVARVLALSRET